MLVLDCFHKEFPLVGSYILPIQVLILGGGEWMMHQVDCIQTTVLYYNSYLFVRVIYYMNIKY